MGEAYIIFQACLKKKLTFVIMDSDIENEVVVSPKRVLKEDSDSEEELEPNMTPAQIFADDDNVICTNEGLFRVGQGIDRMDFCSFCGSVLPTPDYGAKIRCDSCGKQFDVKEFKGVVSVSTFYYNQNKVAAKGRQTTETKKADGPLVEDRKCGKCGHMGMTYSTMQTRSADEGQTVFYHCPECDNQEIEYS